MTWHKILAGEHGIKVRGLEVDLAKPDAPADVLAATASLDIGLVVSNAGFSMKGDHAANDPAQMGEMLMVNCHAPMRLTHGFIPRLRSRGKGGIILTGSIEGLIGCPYSTAYSATKALVKALGEGLWAELQPDGIDVLTLCPGATQTEGLARSGVDPTKMPNIMQAEDVVRLTLDNYPQWPHLHRQRSLSHHVRHAAGIAATRRTDGDGTANARHERRRPSRQRRLIPHVAPTLWMARLYRNMLG